MAKKEELRKKLKRIIRDEIVSDSIESVEELTGGSFDVRTTAGPLRVVVEEPRT